MCYSSRIVADYRKYVRLFGAGISLGEFTRVYWLQREQGSSLLPRAIDAWFADPESPQGNSIRVLIEEYRAEQAARLATDLAAQRDRLAAAKAKLAVRPTASAANEKRIASNKIAAIERSLQPDEGPAADMRIWPGNYAPLMITEHGRHIIKPMRYRCRPAGAPAFYDTKFPGTYNARRDNLRGSFWRKLYGRTHGIMVVTSFYEIVDRVVDGKPRKVTLRFTPDDGRDLLVACLWSEWLGPDDDRLLSFAAITTTPPPEVAAAGHDRCIVAIRPDDVDSWLQPDPENLAAMDAILDARDWTRYENRVVMAGED